MQWASQYRQGIRGITQHPLHRLMHRSQASEAALDCSASTHPTRPTFSSVPQIHIDTHRTTSKEHPYRVVSSMVEPLLSGE